MVECAYPTTPPSADVHSCHVHHASAESRSIWPPGYRCMNEEIENEIGLNMTDSNVTGQDLATIVLNAVKQIPACIPLMDPPLATRRASPKRQRSALNDSSRLLWNFWIEVL